MKTTNNAEAVKIAKIIRNADAWDKATMDACRKLCELADMGAEYEAADGKTFEQVMSAAADKLGVDIFGGIDITKHIEGLFDINEQIANEDPYTITIGGDPYTGWLVGDDEGFEENGTEYDFYQYFVTTDGELFRLYYKSADALANGDGIADFGLIDYDVAHAWRYVEKWYDDYDQETDDILMCGVQYWSDLCGDEEVFDW